MAPTLRSHSVCIYGLIAANLLFQALAQAETTDIELQDRRVDQAALQAQSSAEQKLKALLKKYKNTANEPALMMRLAEVYHQSAEMEFRVAHGRAYSSKNKVALQKYNKTLISLIEITKDLIDFHPDFYAIDQCLFMSAKAHEELGHKELARAQYLEIIRKHTESPQALPSYMALAELAIESNQHVEAISYLTEVEHNPNSPYYPFAIHKLAWSNYNLKHYEEASSWIEKSVRYYDQAIAKKAAEASDNPTSSKNAPSTSDLAMRENILMDAVLFFNDGFEAGISHYELSSALSTFRKLEKGPLLGKMNLRFAKLLRAHQKEQELSTWENTIIKEELERPETIQVVTTLFEHLWDQKLYDKMLVIGRDFESSYKAINSKDRETEGVIAARKLLLEVANKFHELGAANKDPVKTASILEKLSAIYALFLNILPENDPRAPEAHYNLAEALFSGKNFEQATDHYNWILLHFNANSKLIKHEIALKAISSRYEILRQNKLIPLELTAKRMDDNLDPKKIQNLEKSLAEWIGWVDNFIPTYKTDKANLDKANLEAAIENFQFEANRAIYQGGLIKLATDRMIVFSKTHPDSKFSAPSITLALDTLIITESWTETSALAAILLKTKNWKDPGLSSRLEEIEADSSYKSAEVLFKKKDYLGALTLADPLISKFKKAQRAPDFLMLAAQSALKLQQKTAALQSFSLLIQNYPTSKASNDALLTRAQISEEIYDFESALDDYRKYLKVTPNEAINKRVYFLEWLIESPTVTCPEPHTNECVRYQALSLLGEKRLDAPKEEAIDNYQEQTSKGPAEDRPIFSAVVLKYGTDIELRQRLTLLRTLATGWEKLDPMIRLSTLPTLTRLIPEHFAKARLEIKLATPMKTVTSRSITLRAEWIKELEKTAGKILELPWNGIRSEVLSELSLAYSDFTSTLEASTPPKDLDEAQLKEYQKSLTDIVQPFTAKSEEIKDKAKKLAEIPAEPVTISYLEQLDPQTNWTLQKSPKSAIPGTPAPTPEARLKSLWLEAYSSHSWPKNAFIIQELQEKKLTTPSVLSMMKGLTLTASGAKAEAWLEIKSVVDEIKAAAAASIKASEEKKARKTP